MRLTVTCPTCQSQYQVDPNLRGKRMRCPNTICRAVFEVVDPDSSAEEPPAIPPSPPPVKAPINPPAATPKPPAKPVPAIAAPAWSAPPPVRTPQPTAATPILSEPTPENDGDFPDDEPETEPPPAAKSPTPSSASTPPPPERKSRRFVIAIAAMAIVVAGVAAMAFQLMASRHQQRETDAAASALELYREHSYADAKKRFQSLQQDFPKSPEIEKYRLLAILSELRDEVDHANDGTTLAEVRDHAFHFLESYQNDPILKDYRSDVWEILSQLASKLKRWAGEIGEEEAIVRAETTWQRAKLFAVQNTTREDDEFRKTVADIRVRIASKSRRDAALANLRDAKSAPTAATLAAAKRLLAQPEFSADADLQSALGELRSSFLASIVFTSKLTTPAESIGDSFPLLPLIAATQTPQPALGEGAVLGLAPTGVLYAVKSRLGDFAWARRLGIDSRFAPLPVSDHDGRASRFLVVADDRKSVLMLDGSTGEVVWRHGLISPAASAPFLAAGHLLVAQTNGRLDDLDIASGRAHGSYTLDQPLTQSGTVRPGTSRILIPGDQFCVYELDLEKRECVGILESDHPAGSLVGPPIVTSDALVLVQADTGPRVRIRPYPLSPGRPLAFDDRSAGEFELVGTLSSAPWHDAGALLIATEEGRLHQVGMRLPGNPLDPILFPLTPAEIALDTPRQGRSSPAQIVHVDAENLWVITGGSLQRLVRSFSPRTGPTLTPRWPRGVSLGDPVHAAHVHADGHNVQIFVTSHDPEGTAVWMTAVDGETGKIRWRTQLGSVPRGEPSVMDNSIVWNDGVGVFVANIAQFADRTSSSTDAIRVIATPHAARSTLVVRNGRSTWLGWSPAKAALKILDIAPTEGTASEPRIITLPSPIVGVPAVDDGGIVAVALANGVLAKVAPGTTTAITGPDWRASIADGAVGPSLTSARPGHFLVTDGAGGLASFEWGATWKEIARFRPESRPFVTAPLVLSGADPRVVLADADGTVVILDGIRLQPRPREKWNLRGKPTAGPFPLDDSILVVIDGKRLVRIDSDRVEPRWDVSLPADIVVAPRKVGNRLIVADLNGNFWTLDPVTGANLGPADNRPSLSLQSHLAAAVSPVVLPDGRLFVVWSDASASIIEIPREKK